MYRWMSSNNITVRWVNNSETVGHGIDAWPPTEHVQRMVSMLHKKTESIPMASDNIIFTFHQPDETFTNFIRR